MPVKTGTDCGGIRDLAGLKRRCRIDADTGCWIWPGAMQRSGARRIPVAWIAADRRAVSARRLAWQLADKPLADNERVWGTCSNDRCCCPDHSAAGIREKHGQALQAMGHLRGPHRSAVSFKAKMKAGDCVLTAELAQWVRESTQILHDVAHAFDCHITTISKVRRGETWTATAAPMSSVFAMRGAAACA